MAFNGTRLVRVRWLRFELSYHDTGSFLTVLLQDSVPLKRFNSINGILLDKLLSPDLPLFVPSAYIFQLNYEYYYLREPHRILLNKASQNFL